MAGPLRFRRSTQSWSADRVDREVRDALADSVGVETLTPRNDPPPGYTARRYRTGDGGFALFAWSDDGAYWLGNTETPAALWRTDKETFAEAPYPLTRWAQRELIARLDEQAPWLAEYPYVRWFFLPVLCSKDGRESTRAFFDERAAGFPDADRAEGLAFYERLLRTGVFDEHRYTMAGKLGTSSGVDLARMQATMGEFDAAKLLHDAGHDFVPEVEFDSGHALDFQVDDVLVEVTRPQPPARRTAGTGPAAVRQSGSAKGDDQLAVHGNAALFVDCTSFPDDEWASVAAERPGVNHEPAVVFRYRPDGRCEGYATGSLRLDVDEQLAQARHV